MGRPFCASHANLLDQLSRPNVDVDRLLSEFQSCPVCKGELPYTPMSVQDADTLRQSYAFLLRYHARETAKEYNAAMNIKFPNRKSTLEPDIVTTTADMVERADLVFWRYDMWRAALSGSEVFMGSAFNPEIMTSSAQLHIPDRDMIFTDEQCDFLQLPRNVNCMGALLLVRLKIDELRDACLAPSPDARSGLLVINLIVPRPEIVDGREQFNSITEDMEYLRIRGGAFSEKEPVTDTTFCSMVAMLEFMRQPITTVLEHRPDRAERRRLERDHQKIPTVRVVTLRKIKHAKHTDGSTVDWSCRWLVSGFWRNQWYPSLGTHKPAYVHSYLKGPEDKPFKPPSRTIYNVAR